MSVRPPSILDRNGIGALAGCSMGYRPMTFLSGHISDLAADPAAPMDDALRTLQNYT